MKKRKGFTLIELMVVILIVAILAAVAIPVMRGRIDAARWSEGRSAAGTIATAIRALAVENNAIVAASTGLDLNTDLSFETGDLLGTHFEFDCYTASYGYTPTTGVITFTVTVDSTQGTAKQPTSDPTTRSLISDGTNPTYWDDKETP